MFSGILRHLNVSSRKKRNRRPKPLQFRPQVETLEDRRVLSTAYIGIGAGPYEIHEQASEGRKEVFIPVTRSGAERHSVEVDFQLGMKGDTATFRKDFRMPSGLRYGTVRFPVGDTSTKYIHVIAVEDNNDEYNELARVLVNDIRVSGDGVPSIRGRAARVRIIDDNPEPFVLAVCARENKGMTEGERAYIKFVLREEDRYKSQIMRSAKLVKIDYEIRQFDSPTATIGDFAVGGRRVEKSGPVQGTVTVQKNTKRGNMWVLARDERVVEPTENFGVMTTGLAHAKFSSHRFITKPIAIRDNDKARISLQGGVNIDSKVVTEGDTGVKLVGVTVLLKSDIEKPITVGYHTVKGSAQPSDKDYRHKVGTHTFPAGSKKGDREIVFFEILGDTKKEETERFFVKLFKNRAYNFAPKRGDVTIVIRDND